jgi:hypothetical protein
MMLRTTPAVMSLCRSSMTARPEADRAVASADPTGWMTGCRAGGSVSPLASAAVNHWAHRGQRERGRAGAPVHRVAVPGSGGEANRFQPPGHRPQQRELVEQDVCPGGVVGAGHHGEAVDEERWAADLRRSARVRLLPGVPQGAPHGHRDTGARRGAMQRPDVVAGRGRRRLHEQYASDLGPQCICDGVEPSRRAVRRPPPTGQHSWLASTTSAATAGRSAAASPRVRLRVHNAHPARSSAPRFRGASSGVGLTSVGDAQAADEDWTHDRLSCSGQGRRRVSAITGCGAGRAGAA